MRSFFVTFAFMDKELTLEQLEYVAFVARKFCRAQDINDLFLQDEAEFTAIDHFRNRYNVLFKEHLSKCKTYLSSNEVQEILHTYNLDYKKFWRLYLFILDYTNISFSYIPTYEFYSARQLAKVLSCEISEGEELKIKVNGKSFSTINPFFKNKLSESLQIMSELNMSYMDGTVCISSDKDIQRYRVARMKFFKEMMSYFLMSKVTARFPSKVSFIGKFLYLAEISFDKRYWLGYEPRPIRECKKYEILQYEHHSINGIEYVAIPFDVGKNIADTIKKCKDKPNVKNSFYYFDIPTDY